MPPETGSQALEALFDAARDVLPLRIQTDYEARRVGLDKAEEVVELAERFLAAIEELYPA